MYIILTDQCEDHANYSDLALPMQIILSFLSIQMDRWLGHTNHQDNALPVQIFLIFLTIHMDRWLGHENHQDFSLPTQCADELLGCGGGSNVWGSASSQMCSCVLEICYFCLCFV